MSAADKARRLARLAMIRRLDVRIAENRAAATRAQADAAEAQVARVQAIIADSVSPAGRTNAAMLLGAAGLRQMLQRALQAALEDAAAKDRQHRDSIRRHAHAESRAGRTEESLQESRRLADLEAEEKERDDHVARPARKDMP